ncbi:nitroreductase [Thalassococcus lentus]|uniref:Nitroreductase n=1 Tax=Thalassococcus lentus TaxID=1210524 RepID=A0ABT4XRX8_9RHOB|nr:nitroreductase [Thalassococcus lentus]MDA7424713.1 nitroreductase [Thalassococcus lentus]
MTEHAPLPSDAEETLRAILKTRFSCRAYQDRAVDPALIEAALADAQHVASWCNSQPWHVVACGHEETRRFADALFEHTLSASHASDIPFPARYEGIYKERRSTCGWQLYDAVGVQKGDRAASARQMRENFRLFGAPNFLLITTPKALGSYGVLDCGAFVTGVLSALTARGLGSIAMASVAGFAPFVRDWFSIPDDRDVLCGIALGWPDMEHPANTFRTNRAPQEQVVEWR